MEGGRAKVLTAAAAIVGSATIDEVIRDGARTRQLGGVVTYAGLTFRSFGIETSVVTNVAGQEEAILGALAAAGIRLHLGKTARTTRFVNRVDGDSRRQEMPAAAEPIGLDALEGALRGCGHVHLGALHPADISEEALARVAQTTGILRSADIQGYVRFSEKGRIRQCVSPLLEAVLEMCAVVKADEGELEAALDFFGVNPPGLIRRFGIEELVVTAGSRGGRVMTKAGEEMIYKAKPVKRPGSTVGAGDVFFAAYLVHRFYRGADIQTSADRASTLAARHVEGRHITPGALSLGKIPPGKEE